MPNSGPKKEISEFNPETESWTVIGAMKEKRYKHDVSVVSFADSDFDKLCN